MPDGTEGVKQTALGEAITNTAGFGPIIIALPKIIKPRIYSTVRPLLEFFTCWKLRHMITYIPAPLQRRCRP